MAKNRIGALGKSMSVICDEVFDDGYQPSSDEINEYAIQIGINPKTEPHLLYLARDGLLQAIPAEWQICYNDECDGYYYFNTKTKVRQWEHPLDGEYKKLVEKARRTGATTINDLSDDVSQIDSGIKSLQGDDSDLMTDASPVSMSLTGAIRKDMSLQNTGRFLAPLEKRSASGGSLPLAPIESARNRRFEITNIPSNSALPSQQIGLSIKAENRLEPIAKNLENASSTATFKGFTLSGKGSMFLKSNIKRGDSIDNPNPSEIKIEPITAASGKNVKSILRDSSLTDVRNRPETKVFDVDLEDRKSVRFNLNESAKGAMYKGLVSDDSSNDDDDENWDFENNAQDDDDDDEDEEIEVEDVDANDGAFSAVKEVKMTLNRSAQQQQPNDSNANKESVKNLTTLFDRNIESGTRIKPMYEDTDSESVPSIKTITNNRPSLNGDKELKKIDLAKPISQQLKLFEMQPNENEEPSSDVDANDAGGSTPIIESKMEPKSHSKSIDFEQNLEFKWQEEKSKMQKLFEQQRIALERELELQTKALEREHALQLKALEKELDEKKNDRKIELESQHNVDVQKFKQQLSDEFDEKRKILQQQHRMAEEKLQENHKIILDELERDLKTEEDLIKKDHSSKLQQVKEKMAHELELEQTRNGPKMRETGENHMYEKIRCEKRLLEDKYRCLKDKYARLKADVKISLERRHQRREQQSLTTGSETERSNSNKHSNDARSSSASIALKASEVGRQPVHTNQRKEMARDKSVERTADRSTHLAERPAKKVSVAAKYLSHIQNQQCPDDTSISQSDTTISNNYHPAPRRSMPNSSFADNGNSDSEAFQQENNNNLRDSHGRQRKKTFTRTKSASTSRLNSSNLRCNDQHQLRPCTPVENLRRQLQKLEDLEDQFDQFPNNPLDTTYHLRYPFNVESGGNKDHGASSSELEFFKHRIHLERDSVRRAKESLRSQRSNFRARQREVKHHHKNATRHTIDQMIQEEKELTEMEVNLHRTRALLGEKVIRLRHLEQSLQRLYDSKEPHLSAFNAATDNHRDDATISDLSSHSSSGFSSTDFASDTHGNGQRKDMYQESTEIIQSLEQLNAEIRDIWEILSKQQTQGLTPPPSLLYQDLMWPSNQPVSNLIQAAEASNQQQTTSSLNYALNQPVITLADRLETYRQLASGRISLSSSNAAPTMNPISQSLGANTVVSQSPLAQRYKTSLVERTQDLRNWLRQAKAEHELLSGAQQADL